MDQNSNNSLILVFTTKEKCEHIFNAILKIKSHQPHSAAIDENKVFEESFYIPLIKAVQQSADGFQDMKDIILEFVNSLESDERTFYFNIMADITFVPCFSKERENVKDNKKGVNPVPSASETNQNSSSFPICNARKRSFNKISNNKNYVKPTEDKKEQIPRKSFCHEPTPKNSSNDVVFDLVECTKNGKMDKKLLIFTTNEQKQCYEFAFRKHFYRCIKCLAKQMQTEIKVIKHDNGSRIYDFNTVEHVCEPIEYLPENYGSSLIIKSPNFKFEKRLVRGKFHPLLIIFNSDDKSMCYKLGYDCNQKQFQCTNCKRNHTIIGARYIQHGGETSIELNRLQHVCRPIKYVH
uniref:Uncharacterized protein n=1 Tax=Panagrolaimus davidi TaxID=227884 RepID=A0A914QDI0_9BILA